MKSKGNFDFASALERVRDEPNSSFSKILFAAEALFAKGGFASVGIRDIADRAKINVSTLHFHWQNKETLYEGVCRYHASLLVGALRPHLENSPKNRNEIRLVTSSLIDVLVANPNVAPIAIQSLSGKDPAGLANLIDHDVSLVKAFARHLETIADPGSLAKKYSKLVVLNTLYATFLMFVDTEQQQSTLGSSIYRNKRLQKKLVEFTGELLAVALRAETSA